jgi:hypothetical protein
MPSAPPRRHPPRCDVDAVLGVWMPCTALTTFAALDTGSRGAFGHPRAAAAYLLSRLRLMGSCPNRAAGPVPVIDAREETCCD